MSELGYCKHCEARDGAEDLISRQRERIERMASDHVETEYKLEAERDALVKLVREAEWADNSDGEYFPRCPWCSNKGSVGYAVARTHSETCPALPYLAKLKMLELELGVQVEDRAKLRAELEDAREEIESLHEHWDGAEARVDALIKLVREAEWEGCNADRDPCCPWCMADAPWDEAPHLQHDATCPALPFLSPESGE
jgi:hypothetical protein